MCATKPTPTKDKKTSLLRESAVLAIDIVEALEEREPLPEELATDEESRCKYLSKKCVRVRATKAKGELHKLCTFHRAKAIVNQRRLEQRKRVRSLEDDESIGSSSTVDSIEIATNSPTRPKKPATSRKKSTASTVMLPPISVSDEPTPVVVTYFKSRRPPYRPSPRDVHDIEPCRTPATLFPEDLEELRCLVDFEMADAGPLAMDVQL